MKRLCLVLALCLGGFGAWRWWPQSRSASELVARLEAAQAGSQAALDSTRNEIRLAVRSYHEARGALGERETLETSAVAILRGLLPVHRRRLAECQDIAKHLADLAAGGAPGLDPALARAEEAARAGWARACLGSGGAECPRLSTLRSVHLERVGVLTPQAGANEDLVREAEALIAARVLSE